MTLNFRDQFKKQDDDDFIVSNLSKEDSFQSFCTNSEAGSKLNIESNAFYPSTKLSSKQSLKDITQSLNQIQEEKKEWKEDKGKKNYRQGGYQKGGYKEGNYREGGYKEGNFREGGYKEGGYKKSKYDQENYHPNMLREVSYRKNNNRY